MTPAPEEAIPANLRRSAAVMAGGTALSRITGLGRLVAMAYALGIAESRLADSYSIANTMPNVIYELVLGGILTSVFIPIVVEELRRKPHDEAWDSISTMATAAVAVLAVLAVAVAVGAPWIVRLFTTRLSGAEAERQQELATFFLRFFAPQIAIYGWTAVAAGLLNAHNRFGVPMFAPIANNLVTIATFLTFAVLFNDRAAATDADVVNDLGARLLLALGTTAGVAGMAAAHWPAIRRLPGRMRVRFDLHHPALRKLTRLSGWTLGYVVSNQLSFGLALYLANQVQGGPTAFFVAFAFFQLPYGIAAVSIITALVPRLSAQSVDGDDAGFEASLAGGVRAISVLLLPATAALIVLSRPLVQTLLEHGVMSGASSRLVSSVLVMFALGLLPFSLFLFFLRAFYARQDARTPMYVNLVANAAYAALALALFPSLRVRGLALAHSASYVVAAAMAALFLARRVGAATWRRTAVEVAKIAIASMAAAAAMVAASVVVSAALDPGATRALVQLVLAGGVGLAMFAVCARALNVEELQSLRKLVPRRRPPPVVSPP